MSGRVSSNGPGDNTVCYLYVDGVRKWQYDTQSRIVYEFTADIGRSTLAQKWILWWIRRGMTPTTILILKPVFNNLLPFAGAVVVATPIPGVVEAENFDNGGEGVSLPRYHAHQPDRRLSATTRRGHRSLQRRRLQPGFLRQWRMARIHRQCGYCRAPIRLVARVSSPFATGSFHIEMDGVNVTGATAVPNTGGWQNWQTVTKTVNLTAGQHIMRFVIDAKEFNTNKFTFTANSYPTGPVSGQVYRLVNRNSGQVLDVNECSVNNGMKVQQWPWLGGNCQRWKFTATDNGYFVLTAQHSGQALEIGSA